MSDTEQPHGHLVAPRQQRRVIVPRNPTPTVSRMLDDAYQSLAMQLHQFREGAHISEWDGPRAGAFGKLVNALVSLQETERKNADSYSLGQKSDAELEELGRQARQFLADKAP